MAAYIPGVWSRNYQQLLPAERAVVNEEANRLFRDRTGVSKKLDPNVDHDLVAQWLRIRDEVMVAREAGGPAAKRPASTKPSIAPQPVAPDITLDEPAPRWLEIARAENASNVAEIKGAKHNPRIMQYIYTCANIFENPTYGWARRNPGQPRRSDQEVYVDREGEEGVEWCSAFVNWCVRQAGLPGTDHGLAGSWLKWGQKLDKPRVGAVVVLTWTGKRADHVAFLDKVGDDFKLLGGNQTPTSGVGGATAVSLRPFNPKTALGYRWPNDS